MHNRTKFFTVTYRHDYYLSLLLIAATVLTTAPALAQGAGQAYPIETYRKQFKSLWGQGRLKEGRIVANQALKYYPGDADLHNMRAIAALDQGDLKASLQDSAIAIKICPEFVGPYSTMGSALFALGRTKEALASYTKAIELSKERYSFPYSQRAIVYFKIGQVEQAQIDLKKAIAINSHDARARQLQGDLYYSEGRYRLALTEYDKAIAYAPGLADLYYGRAAILMKVQDTTGALRDFDAYLKLKPENKSVLHARGMLAANLGDFEQAMQDIHEAMILPPAARSKVRKQPSINAGELDKLLLGYNQLIKMDPAQADSYYHRGLLLLCAKRAKLAQTDLKKYLELIQWKGHGAIFGAIALQCAFQRTGQKAEAQAIMQEANKHCSEDWPKPLVLYLLGLCNEEKLFASIKRNDFATPAHCYVGLDLLSKGKKVEAEKHFDWLEKQGDTQMDEYFLALALRK
ncbi:tetratricopeptide repeat protein [bacterium]|nr:tetratricopeptide repeat protein [bacterium]MBP9809974.1 tetratricopeptide repeat protein [bacterium]